MPRQQRLVGGDDGLAGLQCRLYRSFGVRLRRRRSVRRTRRWQVRGQPHRLVEPLELFESDPALLAARARRDASHDDRAADSCASRDPCSSSSWTSPVPTVPRPAMPNFDDSPIRRRLEHFCAAMKRERIRGARRSVSCSLADADDRLTEPGGAGTNWRNLPQGGCHAICDLGPPVCRPDGTGSPCRIARPTGGGRARRPDDLGGARLASRPPGSTPASIPGIITPFMLFYALHDALVKPMPGNPRRRPWPSPGRRRRTGSPMSSSCAEAWSSTTASR